ncbi:MAG: alpha/beta hydrolase, partial [Parvularculaceae bacterium]|nr:alpha/beta hydrolase [Parvularculaceae bacterium]
MTPTVDPKTKPLLDLIAALGEPPLSKQTVEAFRARRAQGRDIINRPPPPVAIVQNTEVRGAAGALNARLYDVAEGGDRPTLVYFHGGGFVYGDLDSHDGVCRRLAHHGAMRVLAVEYRLAPEHPFPAPVDDAIAAFANILSEAGRYGVDARRLAVGGDSAGACLATIVARDAARRASPAPRFQLLLYPVVQ